VVVVMVVVVMMVMMMILFGLERYWRSLWSEAFWVQVFLLYKYVPS
jgi:hypothetical protein